MRESHRCESTTTTAKHQDADRVGTTCPPYMFYDLLNRLTLIDGPNTTDDISYVYDTYTQAPDG